MLLCPSPAQSAKNHDTPAASHVICHDRLHIPALMAPMRRTRRGDIHVALSSKMVETVRAAPTWKELYPEARRKVIIWPEKERTVRYKRAREMEGRKAGWRR
jgi:hypothetical protein